MPRLFIKRSQVTSSGRTTTTGSYSKSSRSMFGRRRKNSNKDPLHRRDKPVQGSEAVAVESQRANAKAFKYPEEGFETWIENSLLYTMIRESSIFPPEAVLEAINEEEFTQYFIVKQKDQQLTYDDSDDDDESVDNGDDKHKYERKPAAADVSYAQLTALLALAGEEWPSSSEVPQELCKNISKEIIKYANKHDLDREQELKELLSPLIEYATGRGRKQALRMLPWFAALAVSAVNPLTFYATYMSMLSVNFDTLVQGDRADRNTISMAEMGKKQGNVENASLLDENYYDDDNDVEE